VRQKRPPKRITERYLERYTLYYLERYSSTSFHVRRLLRQRVDRSCAHHGDDREVGYALVDALLLKLSDLGLLNDAQWAEDRARALHRRGSSRRQISAALSAKGIRGATQDQVLAGLELDGDTSDLEAARTYARKRRIGPWREGPVDRDGRRKELAKLARRGFSYDVARRVIDADCDDQSR
jgi:regulatory protein